MIWLTNKRARTHSPNKTRHNNNKKYDKMKSKSDQTICEIYTFKPIAIAHRNYCENKITTAATEKMVIIEDENC